MDNLLLAVSPMFRERFQIALYDKLESVHRHQQQQSSTRTARPLDLSQLIPTTTSLASTQQPHTTSIPTSIFLQQPSSSTHTQQEQQDSAQMDLNHTLTQDVLDDLHNWIH